LAHKDGGKICWEYIVELQKLQDEEGFRLGNKLKFAHIKWQQQKMKVDLAAQSLSSSVTDAIGYCTNVLKLPQFKVSEATVKFIRTIDHLFDILNSRNPCAKCFKAPLRVNSSVARKKLLDMLFAEYQAHEAPPWLAPSEKKFKN
jgi:pyruvate carboxylase